MHWCIGSNLEALFVEREREDERGGRAKQRNEKSEKYGKQSISSKQIK